MPAPPYSSGTSMPISPFSPSRRMLSSGNSPERSNSSALGAIFSCAIRLATSWIINCSSLNPNSTFDCSRHWFDKTPIVAGRGHVPHHRESRLTLPGAPPIIIALSRYGDMRGSGILVRPAQGAGRRHPRAPAGAAGTRGTHRGRTVRGDAPGPAPGVDPPRAPEGRRPGARPAGRRLRLLPLRGGSSGPGPARPVAHPARRQRRPAAAPGRRAPGRGAGDARVGPELGGLGGRGHGAALLPGPHLGGDGAQRVAAVRNRGDRKSTRLNSSHVQSSYAVFC